LAPADRDEEREQGDVLATTTTERANAIPVNSGYIGHPTLKFSRKGKRKLYMGLLPEGRGKQPRSERGEIRGNSGTLAPLISQSTKGKQGGNSKSGGGGVWTDPDHGGNVYSRTRVDITEPYNRLRKKGSPRRKMRSRLRWRAEKGRN